MGSLGVCATFVTHGPIAAHAETIALGGGASMLAGLLLGALMARPILTHDEYVVAMTRGVLMRLDRAESFVPWASIAAVRWDADERALVLAGEGAEDIVIVRTFGRATGPEVAARFEDVRRKELFHLL
jgi:hypothetical protein